MAKQKGPDVLRKIFAPPPPPAEEWLDGDDPPSRMRVLADTARGLPRRRWGGFSVMTIAVALLALVAFLGGTLWAIQRGLPSVQATSRQVRPAPPPLPPLQPVTRASRIVVPVAIADLAIRDVLEATVPREIDGRANSPLNARAGKADLLWTATRGPISVVSVPPALNVSTALGGSLRLSRRQTDMTGGQVEGAVGSLLGAHAGKEARKLATRALDQHAELRGNVIVGARPALTEDWRIEPNLMAQAAVAEGGVKIAGTKINVPNEIKPLLDKAVNEQVGKLTERLRNDRSLENAVRREWAKLCRSFPLGGIAAGVPDLWLEVRPTRALAAQPKVVPDWVIVTVGVEAETRVLSAATRPDCPFPDRVELVPQLDQGSVAIALPIDVPFREINRLLETRLKGRTFPDDPKAPRHFTVLAANLSAVGDRLLIALRLDAKGAGWFGLDANATAQIRGKPSLDSENQILRLTDVSIDVQSDAGFGLLGAAARTATPYLRSALDRYAEIDLKPFVSQARQRIGGALDEFRNPADGVEVEARISGLRLDGIEFDSKTLRVTAEAQGLARALLRKIPAR